MDQQEINMKVAESLDATARMVHSISDRMEDRMNRMEKRMETAEKRFSQAMERNASEHRAIMRGLRLINARLNGS